MRGHLLALLASCLLSGCHESEGLTGHTDASTDGPAHDVIPPTCGDGVLDSGEECDDGDDDDCNGCGNDCLWHRALLEGEGIEGALIESDTSPCLSCPFTIEAWFRFDAGTSIVVLEILDLTYMRASSVGVIAGLWLFPDSGWDHPTSSLAPGVWHHWALTCFELPPLWNFFFWIDGDLQRGVATEEPFELPCELHWMIGTCDSTGCGGLVDDFRVSSTALYSILDGSEDFVPERELGLRPDTILLLDFDHETGGVIPDVTGNGHDALLLGGFLVPDGCHLP